jgi:hypothetical protein
MDDAMETVFSRMLTMRIAHDLLSNDGPRNAISLQARGAVMNRDQNQDDHGRGFPDCDHSLIVARFYRIRSLPR